MPGAFHSGELALQEQVGAREHLAAIGDRVIRDFMPQQHRDFFAQLPFIVAGNVDANGQPWAGVFDGPAGFVQSSDAALLTIARVEDADDPLAPGIAAGERIALLGIEPHTRRRNRANGVVSAVTPQGFTVQVQQSFGNCPKYIQAREATFTGGAQGNPRKAAPELLDLLDDEARRVVTEADTFFIATAHPLARRSGQPAFGVDVSHRGGRPGFVQIDEAGSTLTVPDFIGNSFFNTLGNLALQPRCGLAFIDFATGDLLQLAARGEIVTDPMEVNRFTGAQRLLRLRITSGVRRRGALALSWTAAQLSPHLQAMDRAPG